MLFIAIVLIPASLFVAWVFYRIALKDFAWKSRIILRHWFVPSFIIFSVLGSGFNFFFDHNFYWGWTESLTMAAAFSTIVPFFLAVCNWVQELVWYELNVCVGNSVDAYEGADSFFNFWSDEPKARSPQTEEVNAFSDEPGLVCPNCNRFLPQTCVVCPCCGVTW